MSIEAMLADVPPQTLLFMLIPMLGMLLLVLAFLASGKKEQEFTRRVRQVKGERQQTQTVEQKINVKRSTSDSDIAAVDRLIKNVLPHREQLRMRLAKAGLQVALGRYLAFCLLIGVGAMGLTLISGLVPPIACLFIGVIGGVGVPHLVVGWLGKRRQGKFIELFPDAIDLMVRGLKSGLPIGEAIKTAGEEVPDPVGIELRGVTDAVRMGGKLEEVLWDLSTRLDLQDFKFFTVSLAIQSETGGNLSETLANLSNVLRGRRQLKLKIKAMSSEAWASVYIIGALPFVVGFFIYLVNSSYVMKLFLDERGHLMLGFGGMMYLVGFAVMFKMVKFEI